MARQAAQNGRDFQGVSVPPALASRYAVRSGASGTQATDGGCATRRTPPVQQGRLPRRAQHEHSTDPWLAVLISGGPISDARHAGACQAAPTGFRQRCRRRCRRRELAGTAPPLLHRSPMPCRPPLIPQMHDDGKFCMGLEARRARCHAAPKSRARGGLPCGRLPQGISRLRLVLKSSSCGLGLSRTPQGRVWRKGPPCFFTFHLLTRFRLCVRCQPRPLHTIQGRNTLVDCLTPVPAAVEGARRTPLVALPSHNRKANRLSEACRGGTFGAADRR
jgi:hypothetical protein